MLAHAARRELENAQRLLNEDLQDFNQPSKPEGPRAIRLHAYNIANSGLWWQWTYAFAQVPSDILAATLARAGDLPEITISMPFTELLDTQAALLAYNDWVRLKESLIPLAVERPDGLAEHV